MRTGRHRPEPYWLYRARVALVHSELPEWLAFVAVGVWIGYLLAEAAT